MDLFEFILIITSVIYAMGVAQILSGISRLAQADARIQWFFPHTLWLVILFVYIFLVWWSAWEFRDLEWTFPAYFYMVIAPTLTYFACSVLVPQRTDGTKLISKPVFFTSGDRFSGRSCWRHSLRYSMAVCSTMSRFGFRVVSDMLC